ncbi:hypothetical protein [Endozoicomonas sp. YOMI1]|uniref:hypothetical protein n=1 Tax=Endozoicomonas sp. YOMI1 TaxID=2828739 RepID=UPI002147FD4F|nr:hypothetical protein [Endozoicomonas sp. YOMI1]
MTQVEKMNALQAQIQVLHDAGASLADMRKTLGVTKSVIYYHRRQMGLAGKPTKITLIGEQRQQVKALVRQKWSYKAVAARFGITPNIVKTIVYDSDSLNNHDFGDVLADPVNALLARRWA